MKLCFLADGGVHTLRFLTEFLEMGHEIYLITFDKGVAIEGVKTYKLKYHFKVAYPLRIFEIQRAINLINPDILHALYVSHYGIYASLLNFHPLILSAMGSDIPIAPKKSKIFSLLLKLSFVNADLMHVSDEKAKRTLIDLGCNPQKIFTIEWGVNVNKFSPQARSQLLRKKLKIDDCFSIINVSNWEINYNVSVLIKAIPLVLKKVPNVKFILLGGGSLEMYLKKIAAQLGISNNVLFIGKIPYDEMPTYLASVDVFVETISDYVYAFGKIFKRRPGMGIGQAVKEAMACGTPQILPNHSSIDYNLFKGLTYKQLDYEDLSEKIVQLLQDDELRKKISEESRKAIVEACDIKNISKTWIELYKRISN